MNQYTYDGLSQLTRLQEASGVITQFGYDASGREVRRTDGMGRTSAKLYDQLGQLVQDQDLDPVNSQLRKVSYGRTTRPRPTSRRRPKQRSPTRPNTTRS
ncbi:RHS repeat domain-containing protein, partial [Streptomyces aurantiogriseus]|uniref:RHS repeat domain-containing protein n=1 Tax=Streptomyces aurantiogriseus TaxID=66870 RepID=UPI001675DA6C